VNIGWLLLIHEIKETSLTHRLIGYFHGAVINCTSEYLALLDGNHGMES
jgi:hypothetical protein